MAKQCNWTQESPFQACTALAINGTYRCRAHQVIRPVRYGELSRKEKEAIRARDEHQCVECGRPTEIVDHIVPLSEFDFNERWKANLPSNLQLLCESHHNNKTTDEKRAKHEEPEFDPLASMRDRSVSNRARKKARSRAKGIYY